MFSRDIVCIVLALFVCVTNSADDPFADDGSNNWETDLDTSSDLTSLFSDDTKDPLALGPLPAYHPSLLSNNDDLLPLSSIDEASSFDLDSSLITDSSCPAGSGKMRKKRDTQACANPSGKNVQEPLLGETSNPDDMDEKEFASLIQGAALASTAGSDAQNGCPTIEPFVPRYMVCDSGRPKIDNFWYPPLQCFVLKNCERRRCIPLLSWQTPNSLPDVTQHT